MSGIRVALLTNILPPYRISFLNELAGLVDLTVIVNALTTPDRSWKVDTSTLRFDLKVEGGASTRIKRAGAGDHREARYVHFATHTIPMLREARPQLIVSAELGLRTAQARLYARWRRIPVICFWEGTAHTEANTSAARRRWRAMLLRGIDAAWTNGVESRAYLAGIGVPEQIISSEMTGVDTHYFQSEARRLCQERERRRSELGLRGVVLAYSGSLSSRKGIAHYLQALTRMTETCSGSFSLLFVGDGDQRPLIERWATVHPEVDVRITGFQQLDRLPGYYVCADWFVLPTLEDCWALATVEPIACGIPQVFSRYNGASADLIRYSGTGVLVDPIDTRQFSAVLQQVVEAGSCPVAPDVVSRVVDIYSPGQQARRAAQSIAAVLSHHKG
jgi:glycosyltransferase involved in cell wall biosynthesis